MTLLGKPFQAGMFRGRNVYLKASASGWNRWCTGTAWNVHVLLPASSVELDDTSVEPQLSHC